jgi:hypothetical protein
MAKIDLDVLGIEELAALRERVIEKLAEKVAARQAELEAEMERLTQYGKPGKKAQPAPAVTKPRKSEEKKSEASDEPTASHPKTTAIEGEIRLAVL